MQEFFSIHSEAQGPIEHKPLRSARQRKMGPAFMQSVLGQKKGEARFVHSGQ